MITVAFSVTATGSKEEPFFLPAFLKAHGLKPDPKIPSDIHILERKMHIY
jgi:hypothetical protein